MFYLQASQEEHQGPLHERQLLNVVDDLCRFILHEVVYIDGYFVHPEHELSIYFEASVSGTISNSEPAIVALVIRNRTKLCN